MADLAGAAAALRKGVGGEFDVEISRRGGNGTESGRLGVSDGGEETGWLTVRRGSREWKFQVVEAGRLGNGDPRSERLTKERAARLVSSPEHILRPEEEEAETGQLAFLAGHVTEEAGELLRAEGACYLDAAGNCYLQDGPLFLLIQGREPEARSSSSRPVRAFNASGLKLIFVLLAREGAAGWTYRELSGAAGVSRGAVGYVLEDLSRLGYLETTRGERRLQRREELLERWTEGYAERLRPKLSRGHFSFVGGDEQGRWQELPLNLKDSSADDSSAEESTVKGTQWGGEPAADLLTCDLRPGRFAIYTRSETPEVCRVIGAAPDEEGPVEILDMFWDPGALGDPEVSEGSSPEGRPPESRPSEDSPRESRPSEAVPPLLAYADLVAEADPRGTKAARRLREKYL